MTRRIKRKMMRRAGDALLAGNFVEAENIYRRLLSLFDIGNGNLLDHAACLYNLMQALDGQNRFDESGDVADAVGEILSRYGSQEKAA